MSDAGQIVTRLPNMRCLNCDSVMDTYCSDTKPGLDDICVCRFCNHPMAFKVSLRNLTPDEMAVAVVNPAVRAWQQAKVN